MTDRALATIETIKDIQPIPGADAIEVATIRGWQVVIGKSEEYQVGDKVVYFEIDSFLDLSDDRFAHLEPRGSKVDPNDDTFTGHRLRTIKLRGQVSQGMVMPIRLFPELSDSDAGADVTNQLPVRKWDPPIPANMAGQIKGAFPSWVPKTDAERIQNVDFDAITDYENWAASEKLDGTSITFISDSDNNFGVCSRNWELAESDSTPWRVAEEQNIKGLIADLKLQYDAESVIAQGELVGPGVQKNPLKLDRPQWFCFRVILDGRKDILPWGSVFHQMVVPFIGQMPESVEAMMGMADAGSVHFPNGRKEGVVWRYYGTEPQPELCIKAISNKYLLKQKD